MSRDVEIVGPGHENWDDAEYIKANESLWRKFTRNRNSHGRNFSIDAFDNDVLNGALPNLFYICENTLPRGKKIARSDRIYIFAYDEAKEKAKRIERHLRPGVGIQFCSNIAQFQMEVLRFILKLKDHKDVNQFIRDYQAADVQTTQDVIDFLQAHVDKCQRR